MFRINLVLVFSSIIFILHASEIAGLTATLKDVHVGSKNPGYKTGDCPSSPDGYQYGWHFVFSSTKTTFVTINCVFEKAGKVTKMIQTPTTKHAYVFTPTADKILSASASVNGIDTTFLLSHVCNPSDTSTSGSSESSEFSTI